MATQLEVLKEISAQLHHQTTQFDLIAERLGVLIRGVSELEEVFEALSAEPDQPQPVPYQSPSPTAMDALNKIIEQNKEPEKPKVNGVPAWGAK